MSSILEKKGLQCLTFGFVPTHPAVLCGFFLSCLVSRYETENSIKLAGIKKGKNKKNIDLVFPGGRKGDTFLHAY